MTPPADNPEADRGERGFILQSTYRIEHGCPVVHLFGSLENGETFVVRDTRVRPSFFVAEADLDALRNHPAWARQSGAFPRIGERRWETLAGTGAREIFGEYPGDTLPVCRRLSASGIICHEADLPFVTRYLIDRSIRGAVRIFGEWRPGRRVKRIYTDPDLLADAFEPDPTVIALDIETDPQGDEVYSFALFGNLPREQRVAEVHAVALPDHHARPNEVKTGLISGSCRYYSRERDLLTALRDRLCEIDPDVLTGWNVVDFDLTVLQQAFARQSVSFDLGRADLPCRLRPTSEPWATSRAIVPGRAVVDGLSLLRNGYVRLDDYSLESAARTILGEGKLFSAEERGEALARLYRDNLPAFLAYNLTDARLVIDILARLRLVQLAVRRALLTGLPVDRSGGSIAAFDFLYLSRLHRRSIVAPSVETKAELSDPSESRIAVAPEAPEAIGGYVLESIPGIYENVWVCDYRSLYPSIVRTFGIDPLSYERALSAPADADCVTAPNGARFLRGEGILPEILAELFPEREAAKRRGDAIGATAIKLLMNSFYGVLGAPRCRFHSTWVSNAITTFGHRILMWTKERFEKLGFRVIYGDTDSVFVLSAVRDSVRADATGRETVARINDTLTAWVRDHYRVASHLELEYERLFLRFFMPALRSSRTGSKKRYAGLVSGGDGPELVVAGLESVRSDWTALAHDFQRLLLTKVFAAEPVERFIAEFVRDLRAGLRDDALVYHKTLRKPIDDYQRATPPHVRAARLMAGRHRRVVAYVMTTQGPQPLGFVKAPIDYAHYVEKQLRPIAEAILMHTNASFDEALGRGGQLGLL